MRKSLSGNRRTLVAKCFTIHCCDFKTVRLTFMDCNQSTQLFGTNFAENFKESILLPYSKPTNGEILSENEKSPLTPVLPRIKINVMIKVTPPLLVKMMMLKREKSLGQKAWGGLMVPLPIY